MLFGEIWSLRTKLDFFLRGVEVASFIPGRARLYHKSIMGSERSAREIAAYLKKFVELEKSTLYCYLPTDASWGFPFLMNTDMIPKGDRNDIEREVKLVGTDYTDFNLSLTSIAGKKFFDWIIELLSSKKYDESTVFSLIPDFTKCKREHESYDTFIDAFKESIKVSYDSCSLLHLLTLSKSHLKHA